MKAVDGMQRLCLRQFVRSVAGKKPLTPARPLLLLYVHYAAEPASARRSETRA